jgi:two-component system, LuxR family, sensor kinase FixL
MAALAATGLLLGTTVDERAEAQRALRASLHLAAAGDMAAALAHELNQPLTALSTYAQASQLLVDKLGTDQQVLSAPLADVTAKLVHEAGRAGDVVKRLRDFFRTRSTELQETDVAALIREVIRSQSARAAAMKIDLASRCDPALPGVLLDRVQIEVVLRNLVANALDAAGQDAAGAACVAVDARVRDEQLVIAVTDSGPGVPAASLPQLFDTRVASSKPGGMGIGLGISRTIVEAHGGRLWAEPGPGGKFFFSIPKGHE